MHYRFIIAMFAMLMLRIHYTLLQLCCYVFVFVFILSDRRLLNFCFSLEQLNAFMFMLIVWHFGSFLSNTGTHHLDLGSAHFQHKKSQRMEWMNPFSSNESHKLMETFAISAHAAGNLIKRSLKDSIRCLEDSKFYRNPDRPTNKIWTNSECSKYYLCLDGEVFEFKCSIGLLFDVSRQICDFKQNVDNCEVTAGKCDSMLFDWCVIHHRIEPCRDEICVFIFVSIRHADRTKARSIARSTVTRRHSAQQLHCLAKK